MAAAAPQRSRASAAAGRRLGAAGLLLTTLLGAILYAAFADGATDLPQESWLQLALLASAGWAAAAWLYTGRLRPAAPRLAWIGVGLLVGFAVWTGVTIVWSVAPDRSWIELNRAIAYVLAVVLGIAVGASLPRPLERLTLGLVIVVAPVAAYALIGKTLPEIVDHAGPVTRLRAPLEYWNALALFCLFGIFPALRLAADAGRRLWSRLAALGLVYGLVVVLGLTYSRGGFLALLAGLAVLLALTTERLRTLALFGGAALAALIPLAFALLSPDLTRNALPLAQRQDDAHNVLIAFLVGLVAVVAWGRLVAYGASRVRLEARRRWGRRLAVAGAVAVGLASLGAVASGGIAGAVDRFTDTKRTDRPTDPTRLLSTNSGNRWTWWKEAAGAWADKPVGGWGAGSFPVTHRLYRTEPLPVLQPHSVPLQWLAETGLIGFALAAGGLLTLLAVAAGRVRRLPWALAGAPAQRGYGAALLAIPAAWTAHALYDWDWDIPAVTLPMLVVLGVLVAQPVGPSARAAPLRNGAYAGWVAVLVIAALSAVLPALSETRTSSVLEAVGRDRVSEAQLVDAAADAEVAADLNPLAIEPLLALASIEERRGRIEQARRQLLRALDRQPWSYDAWTRLARIEFVRQDRAGVRRSAQRALELDPLNPTIFGVARNAHQAAAPPSESATATGTPLPREVPVTDPGVSAADAEPAPTPVSPQG